LIIEAAVLTTVPPTERGLATDVAISNFFAEAGITYEDEEKKCKVELRIPFNSITKRNV
jgi:hypothetical protein